MILGNLFSDAQINALKSIANTPTYAETHTSNISEKAWETLYDLAAQLGQKLSSKFWDKLDADIATHAEMVVCMRGKKDLSTMPVLRHTCWAKHLGEMLKSGYSIVWIGGTHKVTCVTWDNWKSVYSVLTKTPDQSSYDEPISRAEYRSLVTARRKEREFEELARPIRSKKSGRCRISFEEARAQRVKSEQISFEARVEARASKILEAL